MKISKALQEVWDMKRAVYEKTKHLHRSRRTSPTSTSRCTNGCRADMKLRRVTGPPRANLPAAKVAEKRAAYRAGRKSA